MQKKTGWKALSNDGLVNPRLLVLQKLLALLVYEIMPSINAIYDFSGRSVILLKFKFLPYIGDSVIWRHLNNHRE